MPNLPGLTAQKVVKALRHAGFIEDRQKGSHLVLINKRLKARTVVPMHAGKTIKKPLLKVIINDAKLTVEEFLMLL